jgi:hypothetical protein
MTTIKVTTMTGSIYTVQQNDAGAHTIVASTNKDHQHIGVDCSRPEVGKRLRAFLPTGQVCRTSEIVKVEVEDE